MEKLAEPTLIAPQIPSPDKEYEGSEEQDVPDPDNAGETMTVQVVVRKSRPKQ